MGGRKRKKRGVQLKWGVCECVYVCVHGERVQAMRNHRGYPREEHVNATKTQTEQQSAKEDKKRKTQHIQQAQKQKRSKYS